MKDFTVIYSFKNVLDYLYGGKSIISLRSFEMVLIDVNFKSNIYLNCCST